MENSWRERKNMFDFGGKVRRKITQKYQYFGWRIT
jgi:hypothetical protein